MYRALRSIVCTSMQVKCGSRDAMRATMGPDGVPVMHRQLHFVLGTTLMYDHASEFGWRRLKACVRCGKSFAVLYTCARCKSRPLCSRACQVEDWRAGGHKRWCGSACDANTEHFEVRDFPLDASAPSKFKSALLGPGSNAVTEAVFARNDMSSKTRVLRARSPNVTKAEAPWDATYAVGETKDPSLANCKWTFYRRGIGTAITIARKPAFLVTTCAVMNGERLAVLSSA